MTRRSWRAALTTVALALALLAAPAAAQTVAAPAQLEALRKECIAAALATQQRERAILALGHAVGLLGRDADGRQRDLADSHAEQERLLGTIELLQRDPPNRVAFQSEPPIDRIRGKLLIDGMIPALRDAAHALSAEIQRIAELRKEEAAKQTELLGDHRALAAERQHLAQLVAQRRDLSDRILPAEAGSAAPFAKLGREAGDIGDLIKRSDAAIDRRNGELLARARAALPKAKAGTVTEAAADPTRPPELRAFNPPQSALVMPVSGSITRGFGDGAAGAAPRPGLSFTTAAGGEAVAPFDGQITYAGSFRDFGVILIIRHAGGYHSLLYGLGRLDVRPGQWVLAGEPVGATPDAGDKASDSLLYFELRRDGRPVDPQPWLATRDERHDPQSGDQRMRE
ncbi:MAG TPA: peptidoglycan DD-metalloendopeptidase family protein [Stellaceae bacterium]|nr:peptidoglycan DD-metalloendopeptidase family protein [Stellaceae bacterium]